MDQFKSRKPVNTRKSKRFHRKEVEKKDKFATEKYWKTRKNKELHQLSRQENEVDHEEFLLPERNVSRWDIQKTLVKTPTLQNYVSSIQSRLSDSCPNPKLVQSDTAYTWTVCPSLAHFYTPELLKIADILKESFNDPSQDYQIYKNRLHGLAQICFGQ
jgi:hypothetical protein